MPGRIRDPGPQASGSRLADLLRAEGRTPGDPAGPYEDWTVAELRRRAAAAGITGRSRMRKDELVRALRSPGGPA